MIALMRVPGWCALSVKKTAQAKHRVGGGVSLVRSTRAASTVRTRAMDLSQTSRPASQNCGLVANWIDLLNAAKVKAVDGGDSWSGARVVSRARRGSLRE